MCLNRKISNGYRSAAEIGELVEAFERCTLPRERWTHAAFLTVALWYLYINPPSDARRLMRNSLKRYDFQNDIAAVEANGYNETLAVFWLGAVNGFLQRYANAFSLLELTNRLIEHFDDGNLPLYFYSREQLFSVRAKNVWVKPDKFINNQKLQGEIIL